MQPYVWWRRTAVALALLAASLPITARALVGPRGATIHVRWQPSTTESLRQTLEARFRLADGQKLDEYTWRYDLVDPSHNNIRALVTERASADTHNIDRSSHTLDPSANRTARRQRFAGGADGVVAIVDWLAIALLMLVGTLMALRASGLAPARRAIRALIARTGLPGGLKASGYLTITRAAVTRFLQRGIPEVDAGTAGLFRILFGVAVLLFLASHPVNAEWLNATFDLEVDGPLHAAVLEWLRGRPWVVDLVMPWLMTTGVVFTAGLFTRVTYSVFVAGVLVWAYVASSLASTHPQSILVLALVALLPSRWGDARSLDSWLRRTRGRPSLARPAGRQYGYSVWVPGLAFGVAFAAAAWAKLSVPPGWTSWILNGTVKYHFISDSVNAPVDWGLQLARHPLLAVFASIGAIATETLVVTAAFTRSEWYRLAMGASALALLIGFKVFMGVFWPGWWVPLLAFLPWERLGRLTTSAKVGSLRDPTSQRWLDGPPSRTVPAVKKPAPANAGHVGAGFRASEEMRQLPTPNSQFPNRFSHKLFSRPEGRALTAAQLIAIIAVIAQQVVVSALKVERAPMFSWYDMYSGTYSSPAAFNASRPPAFRIVASTDRERVEFGCNPHEEFVRQFQAALDGSADARRGVWHALGGCGDLASVRQVILEGDVRAFDWDRLTFTSVPAAVVLGPLAAEPRAMAPGTP